jgi:hypothetical protein
VPPSVHRTGIPYRWIADLDWSPIADAPMWCGDMLRTAAAATTDIPLAIIPDAVAPANLDLDTVPVSSRIKNLISSPASSRELSRLPEESKASRDKAYE